MRTMMVTFLVLVLVAAGCSDDGDGAADDAPTTTASPATTVAELDTFTTTIPPADEISAWPTFPAGEPVQVDPDMTLTLTGATTISVLDREPTIPLAEGDQYVMVRGTVDYAGPVQDDAIVSVGTSSWLVATTPPEPVAYEARDNGCAEVHPDADASVFPTETWDLGWCFAVPADQSAWKFVLDPPVAFGTGVPTNNSDGTAGYEFVWDVSRDSVTVETTVPPLEDLPSHEVGEPVPVDPDVTLTITGIEADPVLPREPHTELAEGERHVLVRGTVDYTGSVQDDAIVSVGQYAELASVPPAQPETYSARDNGCAEVHPDVDATVFATEAWDVGWCFAVPADQSSWKLVLDPPAGWGGGHPTSNVGTPGYEYLWDVSL